MITNKTVERQYPLGHYLAILSKAYVGALFDSLESSIVDRYYIVVQVIEQAKEPFTQQSLGDFLNVDKVTMVRVIDHLSDQGIIERVNNPVDRREKFIKLTSKGRKAVKQIHEVVEKLNEESMKGFSDSEKNKFYGMLEKMHHNLSMPTQKVYINFKKSKK